MRDTRAIAIIVVVVVAVVVVVVPSAAGVASCHDKHHTGIFVPVMCNGVMV